MKSLNRYILPLLALVLMMSCKGVDDIRFTGVSNVKFLGIQDNIVNFTADIGVHNPSTASFKIKEINLKTTVDGSFIGTLSTINPVKIKAKSDSSYHADFSLELANMLTSATTLYSLMNKKQVTVEMKGFVTARSFFAFKKVDVSEKQTVDVPRLSF